MSRGPARPRRIEISEQVRADCVDQPTFRSILGAFPSGVAVITTLDEHGRPLGITCSATCSVSKDPPLLLLCIHERSYTLSKIIECGRFAVNFLRDNREHTSSRFASAESSRFASVEWRPSRHYGLPYLPTDAIAHAECHVVHAVAAGDHVVVIGAIIGGHAVEGAFGPLMYWRGRYGRWPIEDDPEAAARTLAAEG